MSHHRTRTSIATTRPATQPDMARRLSPLPVRLLAALTPAFSVLVPVLALTLAPTPALGAGQPTPAALDRDAEVNICDRTPRVRDAILLAIPGNTNCATVSIGQLADITGNSNGALDLNGDDDRPNEKISTLKPGDFKYLSGVNFLWLEDNLLTHLPAGVFDATLTSLSVIRLSNNKLRTSAPSVFNALPALDSVVFTGNEFDTIPDGMFTGLTREIDIFFDRQLYEPTEPVRFAQMTLSLVRDGNTLILHAPSGVPFNLPVRLNLDIGDDTPTTLKIPLQLGQTTATHTWTGRPIQTVTFADPVTTLADLGYWGAGGTSSVYYTYATSVVDNTITAVPIGICNRTAAVQTALIAEVSADNCEDVTITMLNGITGNSNGALDLNGDDDRPNEKISTLKPGDFKYLSGVNFLWLEDNLLTHLPAGVFDATLTSLSVIRLSNNELRTSAPSVFNALPALDSVVFTGNEFDTIPDGMFTGLTREIDIFFDRQLYEPTEPVRFAQMTLSLVRDGNTLILHAPSGVPFNLPVRLNLDIGDDTPTTLKIPLQLGQTTATHTWTGRPIQTVTFADPVTTLADLGYWGAGGTSSVYYTYATSVVDYTKTAVPTGICNRTAAVQTALIAKVSADNCTDVTLAMLNGITGTLDLQDSDIVALLPYDFLGLTGVTTLNLHDNQLTTAGMPPSTLAPLTAMTTLNLSGNEFSALPDGIFEGVTASLTSLDMSDQFSNSASTTIASLQMPVSLNLTGTTATLTIAAGAPLPLTFRLTLSGNAASSPSSVTIARGATTGAVTLVAASGGTLTATLNSSSLPTLTGVQGLTLVVEQAGICDRTLAVRNAIVAHVDVSATTCDAVTAEMLAGIRNDALSISGATVTSVKAGDFAGLSGLTELKLQETSITGLPSGIFDGLASLAALSFLDSAISTVPPDLFAPIRTTLFKVNFNGNNLADATFPDDLFVGLSRPLNTLTAVDQGTADLEATMRVVLDQTGNEVTATLPSGAPGNTRVNLAVTGATAAGSPTSIEIPVGTTSATVTLLPQGSATPTAAFAAATPDTPPVDLGVATYEGAFDLQAVISTVDICDRTAEVEAALLAAIGGNTACDSAPTTNLQGITSLDLSGDSISALKVGDFAGLTALTTLNLSDNQLTTVPAGIFTPLAKLTSLDLGGNQFSALPAGIFSGLTLSLTTLSLPNQFGNDATPNNEINSLPLTLTPSWTGGTATVTVPAGAPADLTVMLTAVGGNSANATITVAAGATTGTLALTASGAKNVELALTATPTWPSGTTFADLTFATGICDRTPQVQTALVAAISGANSCSEVTTTQLAALTGSLDLGADATALASSPAITTLKSGDFTGLSTLSTLDLSSQSLTALPAGIFTGLAALTTLNLRDNKLTATGLPDDLLDPLTKMTSLDLGGNELSTLPDDIFTGLTVELATLNLSDQFNDNDSGTGGDGTPTQASLTVHLTLAQNGDTVTASIPTGAPANLRVNLAVTGNALSSSPTTVAIDVGTDSGTATLLPAAGASLLAAFDATTPVTLSATARAHTGTIFAGSTPGICTRSDALQSALLAHSAVTASACADVTDTMLQGITGELDLSGDSITALRHGDFASLTGVTTLNLSDNSLTVLTAGIFAGLGALTTLNLSDNQLATVPAGIFTPLAKLTSLDLSGNQFSALPAGIFSGLTLSLTTLNLSNQFGNDATPNNEINSLPLTLTPSWAGGMATVTVPAGAPAALTVMLTAVGGNSANATITVAAGATTGTLALTASGAKNVALALAATPTFTGNPSFTGLTISTGICARTPQVQTALVAAISGAGNCAEVTTTQLAALTGSLDLSADAAALASSPAIGALKPGDFAGLTELTGLALGDQSLTALVAGTFTGLGKVTSLDLSDNQLRVAGMPTTIFAPLAAMTSLDLGGNELASLPSRIFSSLTVALTSLDVSDQFGNDSDSSNDLATLPLAVTPSWAGGTATVTVPAGTPAPLTVMLTAVGGSSASATITVPLAATTGTVAVAASGSKNAELALAATPTWPSGTSFTGLTLAPGICDRTPQVQTALVAAISGAGTCAEVTATQLAALSGDLDLSGDATALASSPAITALKAGDFADLSALTRLDLSGQSLAALTAGSFSGLSALTTLSLRNNALTTVPAGIFTPLAKMTSLDLGGNQFSALPAGIFSGLTLSLATLNLYNQFGNDATPNNEINSLPLTLTPSWTGGTATVAVPAGAPAALTVNLTAVGGNSANATITVAAGATSGTAALTASGAKNVELALASTPTFTDTPAFIGLTISTGICARTPQVQTALVAAINGAGNCTEVTTTQLAALTSLDLGADATALASSPAITALKSGDFAGLSTLSTLDLSGNQQAAGALTTLPANIFTVLSALTTLNLSSQSLTALPAGIFTGLSALTTLNLRDNKLTATGLPDDLLDPLTKMTSLDLGGNELSTLPDDIFTGLTVELATLNLSDQFNDNDSGTGGDGTPTQASLTVHLTLAQNGDTVTASIPTGAPANLTVNLAVTGNALSSSPTTVAIGVGTASGTATLLPAAGESLLAAIDTTTPVTLSAAATAHTGTIFAGSTPGICTRSDALQIALLAHSAVTASDCADVTDTMLQDITGELDLSGDSIAALRHGDFASLTGVTTLNLSDNSLTALPAGIFAGLTGVTTLNLSDNQLATVPAGILTPLAKLTSLDLSGNQFSALPAGIFSGLTLSLTTLNLSNQFGNDATPNNEINSLPLTLTSSWAGGTATVTVPAGAPAALTVMLTVVGSATTSASITVAAGATSGTVAVAASGAKNVELALAAAPAWPSGTTFASLTIPTGICDRTPQVQTALVAAISGAGNCAEVTTTQLAALTSLDLSGDATALASSPAIGTLKSGDFSGLTSLTTLDLSGQSLTTLTAGIFTGLGALTTLNLSDNSLAALPANIFTGLGALTTLNLSDNQLATVPSGIFTPLAKMTSLDFSGNQFSALPAGIFSGLTLSLTTLNLSNQFGNDATPNNEIDSLPLTLTPSWAGGTATVTVPAGAPAALTVMLTAVGGNSANATITVATGATSGTAALTASGAKNVELALAATPTFTGSPAFTGLTISTGICARTPQVQTALVAAISGAANCTAVTTTQLAALTSLDLGADAAALASSPAIGALKSGDFSGLSTLTTLNLSGNQQAAGALTTLPAGIFTGLSALTTLNLSGQSLATLPANIFTGLAALTTLNLSDNKLTAAGLPDDLLDPLAKMTSLDLGGNQLSTLPDDIFTGLTVELATLNLSDQFNDNDSGTGGDGTPTQASLTVSLTLVQNGDTVTASIPTGAPANLRVNLAITGNALSSSPTTIAIDVGTASGTATLLPAAGESLLAAIDTTTPVTLSAAARAHTGMLFDTKVAGGICTRSDALQIALLAHSAVTASACAEVTDTMLQDITGELDLSGLSIATLRPGDLADLTALTTLNLSGNQQAAGALTALPAGIFASLGALTTLNLSDNQLTTVPAGIFTPLTTLTSLDLSGNQFSALPAGIFSGLTLSLTTLDLSNQFGNDATADNEIDSLPLSLTSSWASGTATVRVPAGAPAELTIMLTAVGSATTSAAITLAAGATTGTVAVAASGSQECGVGSGRRPRLAQRHHFRQPDHPHRHLRPHPAGADRSAGRHQRRRQLHRRHRHSAGGADQPRLGRRRHGAGLVAGHRRPEVRRFLRPH